MKTSSYSTEVPFSIVICSYRGMNLGVQMYLDIAEKGMCVHAIV